MPSDASNWMEERESQKDYLSVPSEGTASFKSSSDHDLRGRMDSGGPGGVGSGMHGSSSPWSGSKETLEVIGDKVKVSWVLLAVVLLGQFKILLSLTQFILIIVYTGTNMRAILLNVGLMKQSDVGVWKVFS